MVNQIAGSYCQKLEANDRNLDIGNDRNKNQFPGIYELIMVNQINRVFSMTEQNDTFRIESTDLTADF